MEAVTLSGVKEVDVGKGESWIFTPKEVCLQGEVDLEISSTRPGSRYKQ